MIPNVPHIQTSPPAILLRACGALVRAWWLLVVPGLLATVAFDLLQPWLGALALASSRRLGAWIFSSATLWAAIFVLLATVAHYWRYYLPGRRLLSALPFAAAVQCRSASELNRFASAHALLGVVMRPAVRRRCRRSLSPEADAELTRHLEVLRAALGTHAGEAVDREVRRVETLTAQPLAARRWREVGATVFAMAVVVFVVLSARRMALETYGVTSASMLPTLEPGDVVLGRRLAHATGTNAQPVFHRGDLVVFPSKAIHAVRPEKVPDLLVKRVIGLPGDRIQVIRDDAVINGWTVPSCDVGGYAYVVPGGDGSFVRGRMKVEFLEGRTYLSLRPPMAAASDPYVVKPGEVYLLGDNRASSYDSRAWGSGIPGVSVEALAQVFALGTHRDGSPDVGRVLRAIDPAGLHMEGMDLRPLNEGLARCLKARPKDDPPAPSEATASL
ncbi:MAG: signal peptidase I [Polyangiaceae bacterium]